MTSFFNVNASSLAEAIAESSGRLTLVPTVSLQAWLPDLVVPSGWASGAVDGARATRLLTRRISSGQIWDGCEILNVYRVSGTVPQTVVLQNADRTLRDGGADDIRTHRLATPPRYGLIATRSSGTLRAETRTVHCDFNHYVFNTNAGAALIEQVIAVAADAHAALARAVADLTENLYRSLTTRIDRALASSI
jgi:hypothetical protein